MKPVALVCIAKNEDKYINEWIAYYKKLGFSAIFIYENNWRASCVSDSCVTKIPFDGHGMQNPAYNNFIKHHGHAYSWAAFFDVDEFLVLHKHSTIQEFLDDYTECPCVAVNTVLFGDSGLATPEEDTSLVRRFTKRRDVGETLVRCMVQMTPDVKMQLVPHVNVKMYTPKKMGFRACQSPDRDLSIVQLNHYFCKTLPEFHEKIARGRCAKRNPKDKRSVGEFYGHNFNEVTDTKARDFLYPPTKDNHADSQ